ncbi:MAG: insulinase family protein [Acidobacteria bacterium]|nr:insulinase family protein [Acidobacteriota bacterium]
MSVPIDRTRPPQSGEPRTTGFPAFERTRLANGLELLLLPRAGVPRVEIALVLPAGGDRNPLELPGLASLTASLVDEGTDRRPGPRIAAEVERLGAGLSTRADWNAAELEVDLLSKDFDTGLELLAELAREPVFPEEEIERLRRLALTELLRRRDRPAILAEEALARALYRGTPYAELLLGSEGSLARLDRTSIAEFHAEHFRPLGAALVAVGPFEPAAATEKVHSLFGDWPSTAPPEPPRREPPPDSGRRVIVVDRPKAAQTELRLGHVGIPRDHPDRNRLFLVNAALGGKFTSRINLNLRERHGYTYGASSRFVDRRGPGPFVVSTAVATPVAGAAAREVLVELERIRAAPLAEEELEETRSYLLGVFPYTLQTAKGLLGRLEDLAVYGLPNDHYERTLDELASSRADELLEVTRRHIRPEALVVVAVGPAAELEPQLSPLGPVEVLELPGQPAPG